MTKARLRKPELRSCKLCLLNAGYMSYGAFCSYRCKSTYYDMKKQGVANIVMQWLGAMVKKEDGGLGYLRIGKGKTRTRLLQLNLIQIPLETHHINQYKISDLGRRHYKEFS